MTIITGRRAALQTFGLGIAAGAIGLTLDGRADAQGVPEKPPADSPTSGQPSSSAGPSDAAASHPPSQAEASTPALLPEGAKALPTLMQRVAAAPRRREFKTVPMILAEVNQWDHEALSAVLDYRPAPRQAWDSTDIAGPWLNLIRNALNTQIWSFSHPDFLAVTVVHGTALLALYDQAMWDKYQLARLAGEKFKTNTLIEEQSAAAADPAEIDNPAGAFSPAANSIPLLMRRGVVFMACHNAIWELAATLVKTAVNPDNLSQGALAAELTNRLIPGAVLIPGATGTMPELQQAGFHYAK